MVAVFVEGSKAFSVEDQHVDGLSLGSETLDGLRPDPDALFNRVRIQIS